MTVRDAGGYAKISKPTDSTYSAQLDKYRTSSTSTDIDLVGNANISVSTTIELEPTPNILDRWLTTYIPTHRAYNNKGKGSTTNTSQLDGAEPSRRPSVQAATPTKRSTSQADRTQPQARLTRHGNTQAKIPVPQSPFHIPSVVPHHWQNHGTDQAPKAKEI